MTLCFPAAADKKNCSSFFGDRLSTHTRAQMAKTARDKARAVENTRPLTSFFDTRPRVAAAAAVTSAVPAQQQLSPPPPPLVPAAVEQTLFNTTYHSVEPTGALVDLNERLARLVHPSIGTWVLDNYRLGYGRSIAEHSDSERFIYDHAVRVWLDVSMQPPRDVERVKRLAERTGCLALHVPVDSKHKLGATALGELLGVLKLLARVLECTKRIPDYVLSNDADSTAAPLRAIGVYVCDDRGGGTAALVASALVAAECLCTPLQACAHVTRWYRSRGAAQRDSDPHYYDVTCDRDIAMYPSSPTLKTAASELIAKMRQRDIGVYSQYEEKSASSKFAAHAQVGDVRAAAGIALLELPSRYVLSLGGLTDAAWSVDAFCKWLAMRDAGSPLERQPRAARSYQRRQHVDNTGDDEDDDAASTHRPQRRKDDSDDDDEFLARFNQPAAASSTQQNTAASAAAYSSHEQRRSATFNSLYDLLMGEDDSDNDAQRRRWRKRSHDSDECAAFDSDSE
jgi:hypothetical protein